MTPTSPREVWQIFQEWAARHLCPATVRNYERLIERWLATVAGVQLAELKPWHLMNWAQTWHEAQAVKRVFHWAAEDAELVDHNPFRRVKLPAIGQRHRILTRGEMARLLRRAARDFRFYLVGLWHTLARPQEVRAMQWEQLRWHGYPDGLRGALLAGECCFVFREYKARKRRGDPNKPRLIAVPAALGRLLAARLDAGHVAEGPVFFTSAGKAWTKEGVRLRMKRLRRWAGLDVDDQGEDVVCYTIRHTGATSAAASGVRDRLLAEVMGHASTRTTARYQHLGFDHLTAAVRFLASNRKNGRPGSPRIDDR